LVAVVQDHRRQEAREHLAQILFFRQQHLPVAVAVDRNLILPGRMVAPAAAVDIAKVLVAQETPRQQILRRVITVVTMMANPLAVAVDRQVQGLTVLQAQAAQVVAVRLLPLLVLLSFTLAAAVVVGIATVLL
jgi:hypothetical protein